MTGLLRPLGRKVFGLAMIFNSLVSLSSAVSILIGFYNSGQAWHPYKPYLLSGWIFCFVALSAAMNISSAKLTGRAHIRRILFHHYVYGVALSLSAFALIFFFAPASISFLLDPALGLGAVGLQGLPIYIGLFFVYAGICLVIDDFQDFLPKIAHVLDKTRSKVNGFKKAFKIIHVGSCIVSMYVASSIIFWYLDRSRVLATWPLRNLSYLVLVSNLIVTCLWGLKASK